VVLYEEEAQFHAPLFTFDCSGSGLNATCCAILKDISSYSMKMEGPVLPNALLAASAQAWMLVDRKIMACNWTGWESASTVELEDPRSQSGRLAHIGKLDGW
jgi:hypothetical protein